MYHFSSDEIFPLFIFWKMILRTCLRWIPFIHFIQHLKLSFTFRAWRISLITINTLFIYDDNVTCICRLICLTYVLAVLFSYLCMCSCACHFFLFLYPCLSHHAIILDNNNRDDDLFASYLLIFFSAWVYNGSDLQFTF